MIRMVSRLLGRYLVVAMTTVALLVVATAALWAAGPRVSALLDDGAYHLLVLGSDADPAHGLGRDRGTNALAGRADAIHLISVSPDRQNVSIVSFPRDTWTGSAKLNGGLVGGPDRMIDWVEGLVGVQIDDWAVTGFSGFDNGIDAIGGVRIDVETRLNNSNASTDLQPGVQRLTGWSALGYSRDRKSRGDGDFGRSTGQAKLLRAIHAEFIFGSAPSDLTRNLAILRENVATSIPAHRLVILASIASQIDPAAVTHVQMRGSLGFVGEASVVRLGSESQPIFEQLRTAGVVLPPPA